MNNRFVCAQRIDNSLQVATANYQIGEMLQIIIQ